MSALSDALNEANVNSWSAREIARRADDRVSHSQIGKYLKPVHPRPSEPVLRVFHDVLGLPMSQLRELAGLPSGGEEPYVAPAEADRLDPRQRDVVNELIRMLARAPAVEERADDKADRRRRTEPTVEQVRGARKLQAVDAEAARDVGREGSVSKMRRKQDQAGEPPADNADDMEPR